MVIVPPATEAALAVVASGATVVIIAAAGEFADSEVEITFKAVVVSVVEVVEKPKNHYLN